MYIQYKARVEKLILAGGRLDHTANGCHVNKSYLFQTKCIWRSQNEDPQIESANQTLIRSQWNVCQKLFGPPSLHPKLPLEGLVMSHLQQNSLLRHLKVTCFGTLGQGVTDSTDHFAIIQQLLQSSLFQNLHYLWNLNFTATSVGVRIRSPDIFQESLPSYLTTAPLQYY